MKGGSQVTHGKSFCLEDNTGTVQDAVVEGGEGDAEGEAVELAIEVAVGL